MSFFFRQDVFGVKPRIFDLIAYLDENSESDLTFLTNKSNNFLAIRQ